MSQAGLKVWAERYVGAVQQNGVRAEEVRLSAFEQVWGTWTVPDWQGSVENWVNEVVNLIHSYSEEWPTKMVQVFVEAYDAKGDAIGRYIYATKGRNREATAKLYGGEQKAFADAMQSVSATMQKLLDAATQSAELANRNAQTMAMQNAQLMQVLLAERLERQQAQVETIAQQSDNQFQKTLLEQLPGFLELGKLWLQNQPTSPGRKIALDAISSINPGE